jgi:ligand-binding sensor protein
VKRVKTNGGPREPAAESSPGGLLDYRMVREYLAALTELTGLPAVVRDVDGRIVGSPTALPGWCGLLRRSAFGFDGCRDVALANRLGESGQVAEYLCHGSLRHLSATVTVEGRVIAQIIIGPFVTSPLTDDGVAAEAERWGIEPESLLVVRRDVKWLPGARARSVADPA